jgi:hypothetical protein
MSDIVVLDLTRRQRAWRWLREWFATWLHALINPNDPEFRDWQ